MTDTFTQWGPECSREAHRAKEDETMQALFDALTEAAHLANALIDMADEVPPRVSTVEGLREQLVVVAGVAVMACDYLGNAINGDDVDVGADAPLFVEGRAP